MAKVDKGCEGKSNYMSKPYYAFLGGLSYECRSGRDKGRKEKKKDEEATNRGNIGKEDILFV